MNHPSTKPTKQTSLTTPKRGFTKSINPIRRLRKNVGAFLEYTWELSKAIRITREDVLLIEGLERKSGKPITVFYFGHYDNYAYMMERIFQSLDIIEHHENISVFKINSWIKKYEKKVSLIFIDVEQPYTKLINRKHYIQIPAMVNLKVRLYDQWDKVIQQFRKNTRRVDLRKIRKYDLSFSISNNEQDYLDFYHNMYEPYLTQRFQDKVVLEPESKVIRQCRKGKLIHIMRENQIVAAAVLHQLDGRLASLWVGVPDNLPDDLYRGAFAGLYFFTIQHAFEQGCTIVDFLGSKPFLNDGSLQFKRRWGAYLEETPAPLGDILLKPTEFTPVIKSFLTNNPCIARDGKDLVGKILFDNNYSNKSADKLHEQLYCEGLTHLKIHSPYMKNQG